MVAKLIALLLTAYAGVSGALFVGQERILFPKREGGSAVTAPNGWQLEAITLTAPGHATVLTGTTPDVHGITANDWLDRGTWETRNCVEDPASPLVGISPAELGPVAAAAKAAIERTQKLNQGAAYIWSAVKSIEAPDPTTLVFTLSYAAPLDLIASANYAAYIYDTVAKQMLVLRRGDFV